MPNHETSSRRSLAYLILLLMPLIVWAMWNGLIAFHKYYFREDIKEIQETWDKLITAYKDNDHEKARSFMTISGNHNLDPFDFGRVKNIWKGDLDVMIVSKNKRAKITFDLSNMEIIFYLERENGRWLFTGETEQTDPTFD